LTERALTCVDGSLWTRGAVPLHLHQKGGKMSLTYDPKVQAIQLLSNKKGGSCLKPDGLFGNYTAEVVWMLKKAMGIEPVNSIITKEFTKKLIEADIVLPESFENLKVFSWWHSTVWEEKDIIRYAEKIFNWIKSKKSNTLLTLADIDEIDKICMFMGFSTSHCLAHLINESAWGTSYQIDYNKNGFGIGVTDSRERRYKLKYLKVGTSAYEWCSLLNRLYIPRGQVCEQYLNLDYGRYGKNPEWFNLKEIPKSWRPYATSQSKSVSCGLLVREMREILNE